MITLQERIEYFSSHSASMLTQLSELSQLQEQIRQAQAAASKSVKPKVSSRRLSDRPRRKPKR
jgi:hypothetical protein